MNSVSVCSVGFSKALKSGLSLFVDAEERILRIERNNIRDEIYENIAKEKKRKREAAKEGNNLTTEGRRKSKRPSVLSMSSMSEMDAQSSSVLSPVGSLLSASPKLTRSKSRKPTTKQPTDQQQSPIDESFTRNTTFFSEGGESMRSSTEGEDSETKNHDSINSPSKDDTLVAIPLLTSSELGPRNSKPPPKKLRMKVRARGKSTAIVRLTNKPENVIRSSSVTQTASPSMLPEETASDTVTQNVMQECEQTPPFQREQELREELKVQCNQLPPATPSLPPLQLYEMRSEYHQLLCNHNQPSVPTQSIEIQTEDVPITVVETIPEPEPVVPNPSDLNSMAEGLSVSVNGTAIPSVITRSFAIQTDDSSDLRDDMFFLLVEGIDTHACLKRKFLKRRIAIQVLHRTYETQTMELEDLRCGLHSQLARRQVTIVKGLAEIDELRNSVASQRIGFEANIADLEIKLLHETELVVTVTEECESKLADSRDVISNLEAKIEVCIIIINYFLF